MLDTDMSWRTSSEKDAECNIHVMLEYKSVVLC